MALALTVLAVFAVLVGCEWWWRRREMRGEFSRKFVHITVGSFVAFWPYFLTPLEIKILSLAFIVVVMISKYLHLFSAIHSVQRPTWGEFLFALAVVLLSFLVHHPHIYTVALLEMSLADGLAAVVGTRFGKGNTYLVLGHTKSIAGTLTFFITSCLILTGYDVVTHTQMLGIWVLGLSAGATLLENIGVRGTDNILVPGFIAVMLLLVL